MMATRETGADPPGHNEPGQFEGDTRLHTGIVIVRFMLTVISLVLLIPLAYLMRIRDWIRSLKRRGTPRRARRRFHFFRLSSSRH